MLLYELLEKCESETEIYIYKHEFVEFKKERLKCYEGYVGYVPWNLANNKVTYFVPTKSGELIVDIV